MARLGPEGSDLTHSQEQIWVGQKLHPDSPLYNMAFAFVFAAELRPDLFGEAWSRAVERSDVLRTRVAGDEAGGHRRVLAPRARPTEVRDFAQRDDPESEFHDWCRERCARPLPVGGDLVDSVLVRLGSGKTGWYLNQHHLVTDAWSTVLLYREVGAEYAALLGEGGNERPSLCDYHATAAALQTGAAERAKASEHWSARQLAGRSVSFYGRNTEPGGTASTRLTLELDTNRSRDLERICRQEGFLTLSEEMSLFTVLATLLSSWLHRISGSRDISFDAPVAGRPTADAKHALGLFIEMFPFATRVEPADSFRALGAKCLEEAKQFLLHGLPGLSAPSGATASNVVLNYFPAAFGPFAGVPAEVEWVHPGHGDSIHALRLQVHDFSGSGRYTLHFDFNEEVLPERFRRRSLLHFEKMLDAFLDDPDCPIGAVDILVDEERDALAALNATGSSPLPSRTVVDMFEAQADLEPDRVALRQGQLEVSFAVLREQSEALATTLLAHGVEPGDRVAVHGRRSTLTVVAILAILRARGASVLIDPAAPQQRLEHMLEDCGARILLVGDREEGVAAVPGVTQLSVDQAIHAGIGNTPDGPRPGLEDLAYLMYTSGSTGRPKGVIVAHGGLADYLQWAARQYVRGDRLTFPLFTSLAVDLTITSLFLPLLTGGTLEIYPEPGGPVDTALMDVARADSVDFIKLTPSHLSLLGRIGLEGSRIRRMVVGGENFSTRLAASISAQLHDQVEITNEYGPTEAVVGCVAHRFDPVADSDANVPIGLPADHVQVEILNEALLPVPWGTPGELWISRFGLARGYHGREDLTAESFQPHPHSQGERRYRTGDLVRMTDSGSLEYLGRLDRQLKVAGFRVEPGEIESALLSLPIIEQCAVIGHRRAAPAQTTGTGIRACARCGLPSNYPRASLDEESVCSICRSYESIRENAQAYFKSMDELRELFEENSRRHSAKYDCMMLYSGGKDSSYALCRLVDMGLSVYAFTLDNGFISESAKENIRKVTERLSVAVEFATTPAMNAIFRDSLMRFSNVCNGCFKTIYTLSMRRAKELGIPIIVTGLSRGQMFETRLTAEMFHEGRCSPEEVDAAVLAARKVYHRVADEVSRSLDVSIFADDHIFEEIQFVDYYRYCDVGLDEVVSYLQEKVGWERPQDTGRSTNCLINDIGIYVHKKERGYHNYALPYSWDVRLGHKSREAALDELDDEIDASHVKETLAKIGCDEVSLAPTFEPAILAAYYVATRDVSGQELRELLSERLPVQLIPGQLQRVDSIPLTASGKVDERALSAMALGTLPERRFRAPEGPVAQFLAGVWQEELEIDLVSADDSFFALGGTSLIAMQVMLLLCQEFNIDLPLETIFSHRTVEDLARVAEGKILADVAELPEDERQRFLEDIEPPA